MQTLTAELNKATENFSQKPSDIFQILTRVNEKVAREIQKISFHLNKGHQVSKQMPSFYSTLRKALYFPPINDKFPPLTENEILE